MTIMEDEVCLICQYPIEDNNKWYCDGCNKNIAHKNPCINDWFKRKKECPHCKKKYNSEQHSDIENQVTSLSNDVTRYERWRKIAPYSISSIILGYVFIGLSFPYQNYFAYIGITLCDIGLFSFLYACLDFHGDRNPRIESSSLENS